MYRKIILLILCIICIFTLTACNKPSNTQIVDTSDNINKATIQYVDIYNVVKEAFLTDDGYTNKLSKHMTEQVFEFINYHHNYGVNDPKYIKPFKITFNLKEVGQTEKNDLVYVDMIYSIDISDANNKRIGASWNIPAQFTVKITDNEWFIVKEYEKP